MDTLMKRITINPQVMNGKPCIRNMRFSVSQLLELLASGMTNEEITTDYPYLEKEDILACIQYAAKVFDTKNIVKTIDV
jgi:uncharacterized protein (DUF433 family)